MGINSAGQTIAIATAIVEAGLLNQASRAVPESLNYPHDKVAAGDHDSVGLFQQRAGWGSVQQRMDPVYSATKFYEALVKLDPPWHTRDPGAAAQAVQRSAFPSRYGEQMAQARAILAGLGTVVIPANVAAGVDECVDTGPGTPDFAGGKGSFTDGAPLPIPRANPRTVAEMVTWAQAEAASNRSVWYRRCLAFTAQAYGWAYSGVPYAIDHFTTVPPQLRRPADRNPMPGALLYWDTGQRAGHIAVYLGGGMIASNDIVTSGQIDVVPADDIEKRWGARYVGWTPPYFPLGG
jgi:hypothetical protein